jgi:WD40 repeat protein
VLEGHKEAVHCIALSPDGKLLASGSADKSIRLWEVATGKQLHLLDGHTNDVNDLAFSADGKKLVSCGTDKSVRLWAVPK